MSRGVDVPAALVRPTMLRRLQHTRPDLVVVDCQTQGLLRVVIVEVTVAYDSDRNFEAANERKLRVYQPLVQAIYDSKPDQNVEISVVVVLVGARGVVPTFWFNNLKPLNLSRKTAEVLAKQSSAAAIKGSNWIWGLWAAQAHGSEQSG